MEASDDGARAAGAALPTLARLDALWAQVARRPLWAPPHFWDWWRLRRRMSLTLLRPHKQRLLGPAPPLSKVNDCSSCLDNCCVGPRSTVLLTLRDLAVLKDLGQLGLSTLTKPTFSPAAQARSPALRRLVASEAWRCLPALRQQPGLGACVALTPLGRCGLHPHWPLNCARFPYALDVPLAEVFYSPRCPAFWVRADAAAGERVVAMRNKAVALYNQRIIDAILMRWAWPSLLALGLGPWLRQPAATSPAPQVGAGR